MNTLKGPKTTTQKKTARIEHPPSLVIITFVYAGIGFSALVESRDEGGVLYTILYILQSEVWIGRTKLARKLQGEVERTPRRESLRSMRAKPRQRTILLSLGLQFRTLIENPE